MLSSREEIMSGNGHMRHTILAELGRIEDEDDLRSIARQICELKPGSKEAVAMIRQWRTGKSPSGDAISLTNALIAAAVLGAGQWQLW